MIHIEITKDGRKMIVTDKHIRQFAFIWMVLGTLCVVLPTASTLAIEVVVAAAMLIGGALRSAMAMSNRASPHWRWSLAAGLLTVALGVLLLMSPYTGTLFLTILLIVFFVVEGALALALVVETRWAAGAWRGFALLAVLNVVLAIVIVAGWPTSAAWVPGVLVGVSMISFAFVLWQMAASNS